MVSRGEEEPRRKNTFCRCRVRRIEKGGGGLEKENIWTGEKEKNRYRKGGKYFGEGKLSWTGGWKRMKGSTKGARGLRN